MKLLDDSTARLTPREGVLVLSGFGIRVSVDRGHLVVSDGIGDTRRNGRLSRATAGLKRLVVIGHSGTISLEALRWIYDIGAAYVQLDYDGTVIVASGPSGLNDARLRRAQALAESTGVGIAIARDLLIGKLAGQVEVLSQLPDTQQFIAWIEQMRAELPNAATPKALRSLEAQAANAYWSAWSTVEIRFAHKDADRIPAHWPLFLTRKSPVSNASRSAATPINALLNYLYGLLETEVRLGILTLGLDPGMGMLHSDLKGRDSFVFDVIEPLRPVVDGHLLTLLETRTFAAAEFFETRQGVVRLMPPLTQSLAEIAPKLARLVAPVVEQVAQRLVHTQSEATKPNRLPTLLSQTNRSEGREGVRTTPKRDNGVGTVRLPSACHECGTILQIRTRKYCDECLPIAKERSLAAFSESGRSRLTEMRAMGREPSKGGEARRKLGEKNSQHMKDQAVWDAEDQSEAVPEVFRREILPGLQAVSLSTMASATGLSEGYCSFVRRGIKVPHLRHWPILMQIADCTKGTAKS
jgi:CRISPR-associated protein Cas1